MRTYGQMPLQLFDAPHLPHLDVLKSPSQPTRRSSLVSEASTAPNLFQEQLHSVIGIRWGDFVGSPELDSFYFASPSHIFSLASEERLTHFVRLFKFNFN